MEIEFVKYDKLVAFNVVIVVSLKQLYFASDFGSIKPTLRFVHYAYSYAVYIAIIIDVLSIKHCCYSNITVLFSML